MSATSAVLTKKDEHNIQIRNSTADFLAFSRGNGGDGVNVLVADENVWLTQKSLCSLYAASKSTVSEHLTNIFSSGELNANSVVRKFRTTAADGKTQEEKSNNPHGDEAAHSGRNSMHFPTASDPVTCPFGKIRQMANQVRLKNTR